MQSEIHSWTVLKQRGMRVSSWRSLLSCWESNMTEQALASRRTKFEVYTISVWKLEWISLIERLSLCPTWLVCMLVCGSNHARVYLLGMYDDKLDNKQNRSFLLILSLCGAHLPKKKVTRVTEAALPIMADTVDSRIHFWQHISGRLMKMLFKTFFLNCAKLSTSSDIDWARVLFEP